MVNLGVDIIGIYNKRLNRGYKFKNKIMGRDKIIYLWKKKI